MRRALVVFIALTIGLPFAGLGPARALSQDLVISQVYAGGGEPGSFFQSDFVELFNRGRSNVALNGTFLHYVTADGQTDLVHTFRAAPSLAPGQHLLVQGFSNQPIGIPLQGDVYAGFPMQKEGGKVVLGDLADPIDTVGWGSPNPGYEGTPTPALTVSHAAARVSNGCVETDDNGADFELITPNPRKAIDWPTPCPADLAPRVVTTTPTTGDSDVSVVGDMSVTFSEPVNAAAGWFTLTCLSAGTVPTTFSGGPTIFTLDPAELAPGDFCRLTVLAEKVTDTDGDDPPDLMTENLVAAFMTARRPSEPLVEPSPQPTQTVGPAADMQQTLAWQAPAKLKKRGTTVLIPKALRSSAGIVVTSTVTGKAKKGKTRYFTLIKGGQAELSIRTFGHKGWWLVITQSASGSGYIPFSQRIFYVDGKRL